MSVRRSLIVLTLFTAIAPVAAFSSRTSQMQAANPTQNLRVHRVARGDVAVTISAVGEIEADETAGLTLDQLKYRVTPDSWSVLDVVEHLAVAEPQYWQHLQESLKAPAGDVKPEATDAGILWYGIDRTDRQRTGEPRVPRGRWTGLDPPLQEFRKLRGVMRGYARSTGDDLRGRMLKDGNMDVYQWFLMISTHSQRHILQIREIKANGGFPKGTG